MSCKILFWFLLLLKESTQQEDLTILPIPRKLPTTLHIDAARQQARELQLASQDARVVQNITSLTHHSSDLMTQLTQKIFSGTHAQIGSIPFQVHLLLKSGRQRFLCGGAMLSKDWVVTAAHCVVKDYYEDPKCNDPSWCPATSSKVYDPRYITITVGELNLDVDEQSEQQRSVQLVIPHHQYNTSSLASDIALLRVEKEIQITAHASPIALGSVLPTSLDTVIVSGWGVSETGDVSTLLQHAIYSGVPSNHSCRSRYPTSLDESMWCAGGGDMSHRSGIGDSGGPVFMERDNTTFLVGVTSWGPAEEEIGEGDYDVMSSIPYFTPWILETMRTRQELQLDATGEAGTYTWSNMNMAYQFHSIRLLCHEAACNVEIRDIVLHFDEDTRSTFSIVDGNSSGTPRIATLTRDTQDRYTGYISSQNVMLVIISTGNNPVSVNISFTYHQSNDTYCQDENRTCDEVNDCKDLSDEVGCSYQDRGGGNTTFSLSAAGCYYKDFKCPGVGSRCIRPAYKCDGYADCEHGEDEEVVLCAAPRTWHVGLAFIALMRVLP